MKEFIEIPVIAAIDRESLLGALACITLGQMAKWTPNADRPEPWGEAARGICALLKSAGMTQQETTVALTARLLKLQEMACAETAA